MSPKALFDVFKETFKEWGEDKAPRLGAALAYYTVFSIGPLLVLVIAIASLVFANAEDQIVNTIGGVVGKESSDVIRQTVQNANKGGATIIAHHCVHRSAIALIREVVEADYDDLFDGGIIA
jgi:membrane protein